MVCLIRVMRGLIGVVLLSIVGCMSNEDMEAIYAQDSPYAVPTQCVRLGSKPVITRNRLAKQLVQQGVLLVQAGEETKIFVRNDLIFKPMTAQWHKTQHVPKILKDIARLIRSYTTVQVDISSAIVGHHGQRFIHAIAERQAQKVATVLWKAGLDSRLVTTHGEVSSSDISVFKGEHSVSGRSNELVASSLKQAGYVKIRFRYMHE
jgi:hypothetical protein